MVLKLTLPLSMLSFLQLLLGVGITTFLSCYMFETPISHGIFNGIVFSMSSTTVVLKSLMAMGKSDSVPGQIM